MTFLYCKNVLVLYQFNHHSFPQRTGNYSLCTALRIHSKEFQFPICLVVRRNHYQTSLNLCCRYKMLHILLLLSHQCIQCFIASHIYTLKTSTAPRACKRAKKAELQRKALADTDYLQTRVFQLLGWGFSDKLFRKAYCQFTLSGTGGGCTFTRTHGECAHNPAIKWELCTFPGRSYIISNRPWEMCI